MNDKFDTHDDFTAWLKNDCPIYAEQLKCNPSRRTCQYYPCGRLRRNPLWTEPGAVEENEVCPECNIPMIYNSSTNITKCPQCKRWVDGDITGKVEKKESGDNCCNYQDIKSLSIDQIKNFGQSAELLPNGKVRIHLPNCDRFREKPKIHKLDDILHAGDARCENCFYKPKCKSFGGDNAYCTDHVYNDIIKKAEINTRREFADEVVEFIFDKSYCKICGIKNYRRCGEGTGVICLAKNAQGKEAREIINKIESLAKEK